MADAFHAGQTVPFTGVYKVVHERQHSQPHYVTAVHGELFPGCLECSHHVQFELVVSAVHMKAHPLFYRS